MFDVNVCSAEGALMSVTVCITVATDESVTEVTLADEDCRDMFFFFRFKEDLFLSGLEKNKFVIDSDFLGVEALLFALDKDDTDPDISFIVSDAFLTGFSSELDITT